MTDSHRKRLAAGAAVDLIEDGMVVGLGTGSTAEFALEALAGRVANGLRVVGIPTSERTAALARRLGIPLTGFDRHRRIDLAIDGADEVERGSLNLIKGLGGALLHEKIVASAARDFTVIVDDGKLVDQLGERSALPVEIVRFGAELTVDRLAEAGGEPSLRLDRGEPFLSDAGHCIADCRFGPIADAVSLERRLRAMVGVVDTGLFLGRATRVVVGTADGVTILHA